MLQLPDARLVDARPERLIEAAHLPRAVSLSVCNALDAETELPGLSAPVAVYGANADDTDAARVAEKLRALSYEAVSVLPFGFAEWRERGGATESGPARWQIIGCGG